MATDPYEALQDDLEAMSIANAGLLVEVAELTAIVESVRAVRNKVANKRRHHYNRWNETDDLEDAERCAAYGFVVALLDGLDGL